MNPSVLENAIQAEILTPEQMYLSLNDKLKMSDGVDLEILKVVQEELLNSAVDETLGPKRALEKLLAIADVRATGVSNDSSL